MEITGSLYLNRTETEAVITFDLDGGTYEAKDVIKARGFRFVPSSAPHSDDPAKWTKEYRANLADADANSKVNSELKADWDAIAAVKPLRIKKHF